MKLISSLLGSVMALALWFGAASVALAADTTTERPFVHPLFCDHLVLQRDVKVPVWGWATPGTKVTVTFAGQSKAAVAKADGKWLVRLSPMPASGAPRPLMIAGAGGQTVTMQDVLVGDVWLCSGQSNMEMGIGACNVPDEIAKADFPQIRLLTIPKRIAPKPVETVSSVWLRCTPKTVAQDGWGGFSAAGFFFGRKLHQELSIPIGLINSSWGGTIAEDWTSAEGLRPLKDFDQRLDQVAAADQGQRQDYAAAYERWAQQSDPGTASITCRLRC